MHDEMRAVNGFQRMSNIGSSDVSGSIPLATRSPLA